MISGGITAYRKRLLYGDNDKYVGSFVLHIWLAIHMHNTYVCFESFLKEETTSGFNSNFVFYYFFYFFLENDMKNKKK